MKHVAKFAPIITISWQINELEKILTGPGKLSGVSRNGPLESYNYDRPGERSPEKDCFVMTLTDFSTT